MPYPNIKNINTSNLTWMFETEYLEVLKAVKEAVWALEGAGGQRLEFSSQLFVHKCTIVKI